MAFDRSALKMLTAIAKRSIRIIATVRFIFEAYGLDRFGPTTENRQMESSTGYDPVHETQIGLQTLCLRPLLRSGMDSREVLRMVNDCGYDFIEANWAIFQSDEHHRRWAPAGAFIQACYESGVPILSVHCNFRVLKDHSDVRTFGKMVSRMRSVGASELICSGLVGAADQAINLIRTFRFLSKMGKALRRCGISLHYHPYDFDLDGNSATQLREGVMSRFGELDRRVGDPILQIVADSFWVAKAGLDPDDFFRNLNGHCSMVHVKDGEPGSEIYSKLGFGRCRISKFVSSAYSGGVRRFVVERDYVSSAAVGDLLRSDFDALQCLLVDQSGKRY